MYRWFGDVSLALGAMLLTWALARLFTPELVRRTFASEVEPRHRIVPGG